MDIAELTGRARALAPWHFNFEIAPGVWTADLQPLDYSDPDKINVQVVETTQVNRLLKKYYPSGLVGKTFLDIGCNSGAYCFLAAELGAEEVLGFDVRRHWIDQASFIKFINQPKFQNVDIMLAKAGNILEKCDPVDIMLFKGVLYHLEDPIHMLFRAADTTRETLIVDTASSDLIPEDCWQPLQESRTKLMSGVDGLAWLPGGPAAVQPVLEQAGFKAFDVTFHRRGISEGRGRFQIVATR